MNVIELQHLTKDYGHGRGIFDVNITVQKGQVYGFLGPNGAGKSTAIRHIMGFSKPDKGSVKVYDYDSFKDYDKFFDKVGYIPGEIALPEGLTGTEFIKMMQDLRHCKDDKTKELLDLFELDPRFETKRMSLGDKRKLAIVVAFMNDPELLVLDEPTSGLDPVMQEVFINYIKKEKKKGKTIFLSSHIFKEIEDTCDLISIIKDGKVITTFDGDKIKHSKNKSYKCKFVDGNDMQAFLESIKKHPLYSRAKNKAFYVSKVESYKNQVIVNIVDDNINELVNMLTQYKLLAFKQVEFTLEDYFMQFYIEDKHYGGAL